MSQRELSADHKPSLVAIDVAVSDAAPRSPRLGKREYLDFNLLQGLYLQEELDRMRTRLYVEHPEADEAIAAAKDAKELADLAESLDSGNAHSIGALAVSEGRLPRIDEANVVGPGSLTVAWRSKGLGFGELNFFVDGKGKLRVLNKGMSRQAIRGVLLRLADEMVLENE